MRGGNSIAVRAVAWVVAAAVVVHATGGFWHTHGEGGHRPVRVDDHAHDHHHDHGVCGHHDRDHDPGTEPERDAPCDHHDEGGCGICFLLLQAQVADAPPSTPTAPVGWVYCDRAHPASAPDVIAQEAPRARGPPTS